MLAVVAESDSMLVGVASELFELALDLDARPGLQHVPLSAAAGSVTADDVREYCGVVAEVGTFLFAATTADGTHAEPSTRLLEVKPIVEFKSVNHRNSNAVVRCALARLDRESQS